MVEGPNPEDVMREYLRDRIKALGSRERAGELLHTSVKNVDHIKDGRRGISMAEMAAISGEKTTRDLFYALGEIAKQVQDGKRTIKTLDAAVAAGKKKQAASGGPPRDPKATGGAGPKGRPATQSHDKSRPQSPLKAP